MASTSKVPLFVLCKKPVSLSKNSCNCIANQVWFAVCKEPLSLHTDAYLYKWFCHPLYLTQEEYLHCAQVSHWMIPKSMRNKSIDIWISSSVSLSTHSDWQFQSCLLIKNVPYSKPSLRFLQLHVTHNYSSRVTNVSTLLPKNSS